MIRSRIAVVDIVSVYGSCRNLSSTMGTLYIIEKPWAVVSLPWNTMSILCSSRYRLVIASGADGITSWTYLHALTTLILSSMVRIGCRLYDATVSSEWIPTTTSYPRSCTRLRMLTCPWWNRSATIST